ncbi:MAG: Stage V sporulation protein D [Syntrophorhabdaceae bacterium]|nr:Stage V sporulation protein D [Syntrophorhabdaceae bacterium]
MIASAGLFDLCRRAFSQLVIILPFISLSCHNQSDEYQRLLAFRKKCVEILGPRAGTILAMNPRNGLVLAVVNEKLGVQSSTRPGSTFKIVTALALLRNGTIIPTDQFDCNGQVEIRGKTYRCWLREGHGEQNLFQALANSCNVYFFQAGEKLAFEKLAATARQFHLGECTGINFPNEEGGKIPEWVSENERVNFLVGQARELAVTPLQMLAVISVLANGGFYYQPFYPDSLQEFKAFKPVLKEAIHFGDELRIVKEGLRQSVAYGTSAAAKLSEIMIAGKTGTASEYFGAKTAAWFVGFAPFEKPEIAVVVFLENGRGAMDAAPLAGEVFRSYFDLVGMDMTSLRK